jgi:enediyne biosynthesis protein E4
MRPFLFAALASTPAFAEPVVPTFTDETATSGLSTVYDGDWEYMVGGGVATFDC